MAGVCAACGAAAAAPKATMCTPCLHALAVRSAANRRQYIADGRCPSCGATATHGILCGAHREKSRDANARAKAERDVRIARRRCCDCGAPTGSARSPRCPPCRLDRKRKTGRAKQARLRELWGADRASRGVCIYCQGGPLRTPISCGQCLDKASTRYRQAKKGRTSTLVEQPAPNA